MHGPSDASSSPSPMTADSAAPDQAPTDQVSSDQAPTDQSPSDQSPSEHAPHDQVPASAPAPAPRKSRYADMARTPLRNMVWAMSLTMAVVVLIAIAFFGVGSKDDQETPENSQLDLSETAERARGAVDFPVAEPALGEEWTVRTARLDASDVASWEITYTSPDGELVTLTEQEEIGAPVIAAALPGASVEEEIEVEGAQCQVLATGGSSEEELARGLSCAGDGWGILVHGTTDDAELRAVMEASISSMS